MILLQKKIPFLFLALTVFSLFSCKDKWEEHVALSNPVLAEDLMKQINANPDLTTFAELVVKAGLDDTLAASKSFTVWAPSNDALKDLDAGIVNDDVKLKAFVRSHIANQAYFTTASSPSVNVKNLNGKNFVFTASTVDDIGIAKANQLVGNGVLHVIGQPLQVRENAWEFINNASVSTVQKAFFKRLAFKIFNSSLAVVEGYAPNGDPIYKPGTGIVSVNQFFSRVANIGNEDEEFTYVVLTDDAFNAEKAKLSKYFEVSTADSTDSITSWHVAKDLVFRGKYLNGNFPDSIYSADSVKIHLEKSAIVSTHKVSNGVVYVMNKIDYRLDHKFKPIKIEGELNGSTSTIQMNMQTPKNLEIRTRTNQLTKKVYRHLFVNGHGVNNFWIKYPITINKNIKYKVVWVAVNDFQTGTFNMQLAFKTPTPITFTKLVELNNYNEVVLGEYQADRYYYFSGSHAVGTRGFPLDVFLTSSGTNPLTLDYIKLVPVFN
ncbi:fasciclin domain-containing protein [Pedobacter sp. SYSU D00535]|uniref:fasciclin domain-containing protein n=1 Tax=Pedobacter sp. SYSU D00535 TaxID=2810308 RepID=UPI001A973113|nr:fasciclin domain-containing protein [Pedobacter sp. SYSU D00535]